MLLLLGTLWPVPVLLSLLMGKGTYVGADIGPREYTTTYVTSKIKGWCDEIKRPSEIVDIYPHVAYAAFTHGLFGRWSYIMRTIPDIQDLL